MVSDLVRTVTRQRQRPPHNPYGGQVVLAGSGNSRAESFHRRAEPTVRNSHADARRQSNVEARRREHESRRFAPLNPREQYEAYTGIIGPAYDADHDEL